MLVCVKLLMASHPLMRFLLLAISTPTWLHTPIVCPPRVHVTTNPASPCMGLTVGVEFGLLSFCYIVTCTC